MLYKLIVKLRHSVSITINTVSNNNKMTTVIQLFEVFSLKKMLQACIFVIFARFDCVIIVVWFTNTHVFVIIPHSSNTSPTYTKVMLSQHTHNTLLSSLWCNQYNCTLYLKHCFSILLHADFGARKHENAYSSDVSWTNFPDLSLRIVLQI